MQQLAAMLATQNTSQGANPAAAPNPPLTREEVDFRPRSSTVGRSSDPADAEDGVERGRSPRRPSPSPSNAAAQSAATKQSRSKAKSPARHHSPSSPLRPLTPPMVQSPQRPPPAIPSSPPHYRHDTSSAHASSHSRSRGNARSPSRHSRSPDRHSRSPGGCSRPSDHRSRSLSRRPHSPDHRTRTRSPDRRTRSPSARSPTRRSVTHSPDRRTRSRSPEPHPRGPAPKRRRRARSRSRSRSQDNQAGERYENCPSSYEKRPGTRGGRITKVVNGKEKIVYTDVEKLGTREAKYEYFKTHRHPFGAKYDMYFNPYSTTTSDIKNYKRIGRPSGLQVGRGDSKLMHEVMGCRPDYDFYTQFSGDLREAVQKYRPKHVPDGEKVKWSQYGTTVRRKVYHTILKKYPFCHHFRDETNEDNWVINLMATNYLSHTRAYATEKKRTRYLRRRKSQSGQDKENTDDEEEEIDQDEEEEVGHDKEEIDEEDAAPGEGEDDYAANAPVRGAPPRSSTGHNRNKPARASASSSSRSAPSSRPDTTSHGSTLPAQTSNRDNRRADKVVAAEEALAKVDDLRASKTAKGANASKGKGKGKGKGKEIEARPARKDALDGEESESEEEALRLVPVKVSKAARAQARIGSPEPTEPPKGKKRKVAEAAKEPEPADDIQEPAAKKQKPQPKMRPPPDPEPEPSGASASSAIPISSDAPDAPATTVPSTSSKVVSTKKALVPVKSAGVKGTRATTCATTRATTRATA
ncbi:hypothetical protein FS749_009891 [Ceratobasidium sp. UAMH 11750]|nr:hypothetical protein FS749_009891 [Ceratobasidium sp. UAMH 11750]